MGGTTSSYSLESESPDHWGPDKNTKKLENSNITLDPETEKIVKEIDEKIEIAMGEIIKQRGIIPESERWLKHLEWQISLDRSNAMGDKVSSGGIGGQAAAAQLSSIHNKAITEATHQIRLYQNYIDYLCVVRKK